MCQPQTGNVYLINCGPVGFLSSWKRFHPFNETSHDYKQESIFSTGGRQGSYKNQAVSVGGCLLMLDELALLVFSFQHGLASHLLNSYEDLVQLALVQAAESSKGI